MELKDTIKMMDNADYKERFKAEYLQVAIRYQKLMIMLNKWDNGGLDFTPTCPRSTYDLQTKAMKDYIAVLEMRAVIEGVDLPTIEVDSNSPSPYPHATRPDLTHLPDGTLFHVANGGWTGKIIDKNGEKYVVTPVFEYKVTENNKYDLYLDSVTFPE